ncbi:MAG: esterase/lipase family protein [Planctomyces sp.]
MERLHSTGFGPLNHSDRTENFFLTTGYQGSRAPGALLKHARLFNEGPQRFEAWHAAAELNYLGAQAISGRDPSLAAELWLDSAAAAWKYFSTPDDSGHLPGPTESEHRSTAEVYNASCELLLRHARTKTGYRLGHSYVMPLTQRHLQFELPFESRQLQFERLGDFEFTSDYNLKNLRNHHTSSGLGVPLIVVRHSSTETSSVEEYYTKGMSCAATAVIRFGGADTGASPVLQSHDFSPEPTDQSIRFQLYDPRETDGIVLRDTLIPLETDVSTPLARFLSNPDLKLLDTWGFLRPDRAHSVEGLYMVQPYDPDRIPVLMVHGLWSSPMTWMEMFNDLQADPEIRRRYQFWFYLYPTGESLAFSAANLREELDQVRRDCDPHLQNTNLDRMVVVGHSMGGLISHMMTINSEDRLWNSVSKTPLEKIQAKPEEKSEIRRVFFFESNPSVSRIVTIASPYGGSRYSNAFTRWVSGTLIWLPSRTLQLSRLVFEQNQTSWWDRWTTQRTSLDSLTKKSAVLTLIRETRVPPDVKHHNVVGISRGKSDKDWTDGVVSYRSAHRSDVASEISVNAAHSAVHRHPETIAEVRRILLEHLSEIKRRRFPVVPVRHQNSDSTGRARLQSLAP